MEIEREVLREDTIFENVIEQAFVAGPEPDGVVGEIGVSAVSSKVDEEKGHAVAHGVQFSIGPFMSCGCGDFFLIEICDVRIGDNYVRPKGFTRAEPNSRRRPVFHEKFVHGRVEAKLSTQIFQEFDEGLDKGARASHGKVNSPFALQIVDHGVDGGGLERIATDEKRMEGEDFT